MTFINLQFLKKLLDLFLLPLQECCICKGLPERAQSGQIEWTLDMVETSEIQERLRRFEPFLAILIAGRIMFFLKQVNQDVMKNIDW